MALRLRRRCKRARDVHQLPSPQGRPLRPAAHPDGARRGLRAPNAEEMTLSLRGRLLIGVISLVLLVLIVSDVVVYGLLEKSLVGGIDQQLLGGRVEANSALGGFQRGGPQPSNFPTGTVVELVRADGSVISAKVSAPFGDEASEARPVLPAHLPVKGSDSPADPYTVAGTNGTARSEEHTSELQ